MMKKILFQAGFWMSVVGIVAPSLGSHDPRPRSPISNSRPTE